MEGEGVRFEDIHWHGGRILAWTITSGDEGSATATVELDLAVHEGPDAPKRVAARLVFEGVESLSLSCNFPSLSDRFATGNIHWAHREGPRTYRFELFGDNAFELVADTVSIHRED
ncbi:MAG: hypothetical protein JSU82_14565 [Rhodospirillales bacterium]|nr:MAG: hypothetical protein JSU82_14565 [Rhodospirillales bacterium]